MSMSSGLVQRELVLKSPREHRKSEDEQRYPEERGSWAFSHPRRHLAIAPATGRFVQGDDAILDASFSGTQTSFQMRARESAMARMQIKKISAQFAAAALTARTPSVLG